MKINSTFGLLVALLFAVASLAQAEVGTPEEAKAMSEKAAGAVNDMGSEKAFAAFGDKEGDFHDKDLYVFCVDMEGNMLAHGVKPSLVGKNLLEFNKYGDFLFKDMIKVASEEDQGWVDYKWPYPDSEEIREKTSYVIKNNEGFLCGVGAYK